MARLRPGLLPLAAVVVAFASWHVGSLAATAGLDPSWQVALHLTALRGIDFGSTFAWTYGPLGFLAFPIAVSSWTLAASFVFVALTQLALCTVLVRRAGAAFGIAAGVVLAYLAAALPLQPSGTLLLIAVGLAALAFEDRTAMWALPVLGAVAGLAALVKTNSGAAAIGVVIVVAVARRDLLAPAAALVTFVVAWVATGNDLTAIPGWLRMSASLVSGYSAAMEYEQPGLRREYVYAGVVIALLIATAVLARRSVACALVAAGIAFVFFKEGFVRHDPVHSALFFAYAAIAALLLAQRNWSRIPALGVLGVAILATHQSHVLHYAPVAAARTVVHQARDVVSSGVVAGSRASMRASDPVPQRLLRELRGHTVHVDPFETSVIAAYGLRWRPLPVVQAYSAYTSYLDEANARFLGSAAAPERVLRENTPVVVNGRGRELQAPAELAALVCDYTQAGASAEWQVLAHIPSRCGKPRVLSRVRAYRGVPVTVPDANEDDLVVAHISMVDPKSNAVRGLVFKPKVPYISLGGGPYVQLVAATAPDGIVVHVPGSSGWDPRLGGAIDWRTLAVATVRGGITVEFDAIRVRGREPKPQGALPHMPLPNWRLLPTGVQTPAGALLPVSSGGGFADSGWVRRDRLVIRGWAGDAAGGVPASPLLVFADGALVYAGAPNVPRPDVADATGKPALDHAGYQVQLPLAAVRNGHARRHLRIFAVVDGRALEVAYLPPFGWR